MGADLAVADVDAGDGEVVDIVGEVQFDHVLVVAIERLLEGRLLGKRHLGVEDDEFRFRFGLLQVIGDDAGALVRSRRAAVGHLRRGDDDGAAVFHFFQALTKGECLIAAAPGVGHRGGGLLAVAFDGGPLEIDARGDDEAIVFENLPLVERDGFLRRIDCYGAVVHDRDAGGGNPFIAMRKRTEGIEAADVGIGEEAARVFRLRLHQGHIERGRQRLQRAGDRRAARSAPPPMTTIFAAPRARAGPRRAPEARVARPAPNWRRVNSMAMPYPFASMPADDIIWDNSSQKKSWPG